MRDSTKTKPMNKIRIPVSFTHFYGGNEQERVNISSIDKTIEKVSQQHHLCKISQEQKNIH